MAVPSRERVCVGGQSITAVEPREPRTWYGEGLEEWERRALGVGRVAGRSGCASAWWCLSLPWGTGLEHLFEGDGSLKAGIRRMTIVDSVLDLLLVALEVSTRRILVSDVVIPLPPTHTLKYFSSLGR